MRKFSQTKNKLEFVLVWYDTCYIVNLFTKYSFGMERLLTCDVNVKMLS
jgi:hypothetical protein